MKNYEKLAKTKLKLTFKVSILNVHLEIEKLIYFLFVIIIVLVNI